ncbi:spore coat protein [Acetohalobium arabaticum]|uniref:Coat F domain protein n=1 Tax=Acetohalobium arabaticum (strain ATCC 49924 / DSM 5501 / Z-7288) TaxID=574087 RepID=D9QSM5_ACEAZ|nr:spore coat protein [Acetohalobium arabaticum]ADL13488.1 Coat F domain protein [Acetohalobium arabaticum DSM 5501]
MNLQDKEMARDMLIMMEQLIQTYTKSELEAANKSLREVFHDLNKDMEVLHTELFNLMQTKGWSEVTTASQQEIESEIISWEQKGLKDDKIEPVE